MFIDKTKIQLSMTITKLSFHYFIPSPIKVSGAGTAEEESQEMF